MLADGHRAIAGRIQSSTILCQDDDWEMRIEGAMLAGTHWVNMVLHQLGHTPTSSDIVHTTMLSINEMRKYRLILPSMIDKLAEVEALRPLHVRGNAPGGVAAGRRAAGLLKELSDEAHAHLLDAEVRT